MPGRIRTLTLWILLFISLGANGYLVLQMMRLYRSRTLLTLDPAPASAFATENRALGSPAAGRVRVVFFGDSRIRDWEPLPGLPAAESINRGRRGDTTAMALRRLQQDVIALQPRVVVLQVGINDLKAVGVIPGHAHEILATACRNVADLVTELRKHGMKVIVLTVWPRGPLDPMRFPFAHPEVDRAIQSFNTYLGTLAGDGITVLDCGSVLAPGGRVEAALARDMLHLNAAGYNRLAEVLIPRLATSISGP